MKSEDNSVSLLQDYLGFDVKTLVTFSGLVLGVLALVTGIYISIFGFDTWKTNMERAGSMMVINFDPQLQGAPDVQGAQPLVPIAAPAPPAAAQFACPGCGTTGLPLWTENGTPVCPNCGTVMGVTGPTAVPQPAATF